jgi:hypothetical protein
MTEQIIIIALLVLSIHYTMQPDEIFGKLGDWLEDHLPDAIHPAVFTCNICMCPWYGSVLYWLIPWQRLGLPAHDWVAWPVVVIGAMGVNVVINKWTPDKKEQNIENPMIPINVLNAYEKVKGISVLQSKYSHSEDWKVLFKFYNDNNTKHLGMSCFPCFTKVLAFVGLKIKSVGV